MANQFDDLKLGMLVIVKEDQHASPLPLEATEVSGQITGPVASVTVSQQFGNPFKEPLELEYLFPLPEQAAIFDYAIRIGARTITAEIKEKEAARQTYHKAVEEGKRASLLEARRSNLFSIQIGNVQPGEQIVTTIRYQEPVHYDDGSYEFVFPMGITPKYHTPTTSESEAASVDAPVVKPGSTDRIAPVKLSLTVDAGTLAGEPTSRSHAVNVVRHDERRFSVTLTGGQIANKDFVLRYPVSAEAVRAAAWVSAGEGHPKSEDAETALISLLPPPLIGAAEPDPREFIFVIDRSGSMSGGPLAQAQNALRACLRALGMRDTFAIQAFDDQIEWFDKQVRPVTQANVEAADAWLAKINARGGTEILPTIDSALSLPADPERTRYVVFLTDGAVSAEDRAISDINKKRRGARIFTFGIGPSVNRALLNKMAQFGRGRAEFLGVEDDIEKAITRFQDRVSYPALTDIELKWQRAETWDAYPASLPDLYIGQPLTIVARLKRAGDAALELSGRRGKEDIRLNLPIPPAAGVDPAIGRLWARARIEALLDAMREDRDHEKLRAQIISLALDHRLVTPFTSFVAADSEQAEQTAAPRHVRVSVPLPEGLEYEGFFGPDTDALPGFGFLAGGGMMAMPSLAKLPAWLGTLSSTPPDDDEFGVTSAMPPPRYDKPRRDRALRGLHELSLSAAPADPLRELARTQNTDGSWGAGAEQVERTAAALLAFVRIGHTTRRGDYRRQVKKAADWLKAALPAASGFPACAAIRALTELDALDGTHYAPTALPTPTTDAERAALTPDAVARPARIATLDDLRIAALVAGAITSAEGGLSGALVEVWQAVGKR